MWWKENSDEPQFDAGYDEQEAKDVKKGHNTGMTAAERRTDLQSDSGNSVVG